MLAEPIVRINDPSLYQVINNFSDGRTTFDILVLREAQNIDLCWDLRTTRVNLTDHQWSRGLKHAALCDYAARAVIKIISIRLNMLVYVVISHILPFFLRPATLFCQNVALV
jgi:hypothetical protein